MIGDDTFIDSLQNEASGLEGNSLWIEWCDPAAINSALTDRFIGASCLG